MMNITDVVTMCRDTGLDWFEQLLENVCLCTTGSLNSCHKKYISQERAMHKLETLLVSSAICLFVKELSVSW